jgi:D-glycero-D-manno-heptose 1,7-bisphosphate phosphatase
MVSSGYWTIFLDRDGTIMVDSDYPSDPDAIVLEEGAIEGLRLFAAAGARLVVVTNQSGVGRGYFSESAANAVNHRLGDILSAQGVVVEGWYLCPHHPDNNCACRKPALGLVHRAAQELALDLDRSIVIGDKLSDIGLAKALSISGILVRTGKGKAACDDAIALGARIADNLIDAFFVFCAIREAADASEPL